VSGRLGKGLGQKRCRNVQKRLERSWESAEGLGRHGNVTLCYNKILLRILDIMARDPIYYKGLYIVIDKQ